MKKILLIISIISVLFLVGCNTNNNLNNNVLENDNNQNLEYVENSGENIKYTDNIDEEVSSTNFSIEELVLRVTKDSHFNSKLRCDVKTMNSYNHLLELTENEYDNIINEATDISFDGGQIYIFELKNNTDSPNLFEKAKNLDIGSWYRFYNEKYVVINSSNYLILVLANDELNAPETDANIIKEIYLNYFGEFNTKNVYEKTLEGSHIPMDESI